MEVKKKGDGSNNELIRDNGETVSENITMNFLERNNDGTEKLRPLVKFLRFNSSPKGIVYGIPTQDILIKTSYLKMIEVIENDRGADKEKVGCMIIGSPGIGKTHFSLYLAFYITRRYFPADFIYQQLNEGKSHTIHISQKNMSVIEYPRGLGGEFPINSFYIADSVIPSLCTTKFTFLVTTPKNDRWHEFDKQRGTQKYYAPIWTDEEVWDVWEWDKRDYKNIISKTRVEELITRWGCVPRRIFNEYNKEPKIGDIVSKCNAFRYLTNEGGDLNDKYSGKAIHIYPSSDFKDKEYVIASAEISRALYDHYAKNAKNIIVDVVKNFAKTSGGPLAGKLFEMMAHDILRRGGNFKVRRLTKKGDNNIFSEESRQLQKLKMNPFHNISEIVSGGYNIPEVENFESVDSIVPKYNNQVNYLYQMTIAETHKTKVNGLTKLQDKMDMNLPTHLYFVVPNINDLFNNYYLQDYITLEKKNYVGWNSETNWIKGIIQYVLLIDLSDF
ncbi:unnamed protein product [Rhizophagus irregularis]|uniref:Crinkler family protein n=1 Tax=Rhizophagus irregularis TaxID=588596 RepID=A0A2I1HHM7_9GLOM|nr:hypothetical protein RhiirA4_550034 [Rhizophagus irregularis]CAB4436443.1 unnamed protein product [Rhizophagus irregularis]CAB4436530.1 unnamed protein product [Rhizophagus irregularis]